MSQIYRKGRQTSTSVKGIYGDLWLCVYVYDFM